MADTKMTETDPKAQFWEEADKVKAGMLKIEGSGHHSQPMSPQLDPDAGKVWFFISTDADLAQSVKAGHDKAHFTVTGEDHDYWACVSGKMAENKDPAKVEEFWSPMVAAWFEGGKDDPKMTLYEMTLSDGQVWSATDSSAKFGWEIAKANLMDEKTPNVGAQNSVRF